MIRGLGAEMASTYSQTPNGCEVQLVKLLKLNLSSMMVPSGPFLVSRTGAVGWTKRQVKVPDADANEIPWKVLVAKDSRTVAMEVGIR
jgi:hypothetical protein